MKSFEIQNVNSVHNFLFEVYCRCGIFFDPAEDLKFLCDKNGSPFFIKEESEYLDKIMTECFIYCVLNDLNIYEIVKDVQLNISSIKAVA